MNRWELENVRAGVAQELEKETNLLNSLYQKSDSSKESRSAQQTVVEDLKERLQGIAKQVTDMDADAAKKAKKQMGADGVDEYTVAKAALYRSTMNGEPIPTEHRKALNDDATTGGEKFLPKTVSNTIVSEPLAKNPLREPATMTNITNLEVPKIAFSIEDDDFIEDGETAKEIKATGSIITFARNKFKVFVDVSETVLQGTDTNLVGYIENGLHSGLAKKEKKVAFANPPKTGEEHMSFYQKDGADYAIKTVKGAALYDAITDAIADLEEDFRESASICMRYQDYNKMIRELANGNTTLYGVQPESVLGKPVIFCDHATIPVVGDFNYLHYNYDLGMQYEKDKNVKTGIFSFVLTAWFDTQIKLKSAFRLVEVTAGGGLINP